MTPAPFTNDVMNIDDLPKYEEVTTTPIQRNYWKVIMINLFLSFMIFGSAVVVSSFYISDLKPFSWYIIPGFIVIMGLITFLQKIAFKKKSYAVRERDIIYHSGILANHTIIIPFNRIQHVGMNEGLISRFYGLAQLQIFTAGGSSSDLKISGLLKQEAERVREVIMQKIVEKKPQ